MPPGRQRSQARLIKKSSCFPTSCLHTSNSWYTSVTSTLRDICTAIGRLGFLWAGLFGLRVEFHRPPPRDARGRFRRAGGYASGPAEAVGLHPKLNEFS